MSPEKSLTIFGNVTVTIRSQATFHNRFLWLKRALGIKGFVDLKFDMTDLTFDKESAARVAELLK